MEVERAKIYSLAKVAKATKRKLLVSQAFSIMLDSLFF